MEKFHGYHAIDLQKLRNFSTRMHTQNTQNYVEQLLYACDSEFTHLQHCRGMSRNHLGRIIYGSGGLIMLSL